VNLLLSTLSPWPIAFWAAYLIGRWYVCRLLPRLLSDVIPHSVSESAEVLGEASPDAGLKSTHRFRNMVAWLLGTRLRSPKRRLRIVRIYSKGHHCVC
jgi:hypothetical protein